MACYKVSRVGWERSKFRFAKPKAWVLRVGKLKTKHSWHRNSLSHEIRIFLVKNSSSTTFPWGILEVSACLVGYIENESPNLQNCHRSHQGKRRSSSSKTRWWFQLLFLFSSLLGEDSHFDEHIFQMGGEKPPTRKWLEGVSCLFLVVSEKFHLSKPYKII